MIIISDIHSNLEAIQAVIRNFGDDKNIITLGDVVGYGPNPSECLNLVREIIYEDKYVRGNHETMVLDDNYRNNDDINPIAVEGAEYSIKNLSDEQKKYLEQRPSFIIYNGCYFVHGSPPDSYEEYLISDYVSLRNIEFKFKTFEEKICFVGHSHRPEMWVLNIETGGIKINNRFKLGLEIILAENERAIVNVGSVGQPRDGDARASFCFYDEERKACRLERVEYDYNMTRKKIIDSGLPVRLGDRLINGC